MRVGSRISRSFKVLLHQKNDREHCLPFKDVECVMHHVY